MCNVISNKPCVTCLVSCPLCYRTQLIPNMYDITITSDPVSTDEKICLTVSENKVRLCGLGLVVVVDDQPGACEIVNDTNNAIMLCICIKYE